MCAHLSQSWIIQLMLLLNLTHHVAQRQNIFYVIFHQMTLSNQYTCSIHEATGRRFCNRAKANVFSNNKRKLSTDPAVVDGLKAFEIFIILKFYFIF